MSLVLGFFKSISAQDFIINQNNDTIYCKINKIEDGVIFSKLMRNGIEKDSSFNM